MRRSLPPSHYQLLEPEERFRLILAAQDRLDDVERERLRSSSPEMTVSTSDHMPWSMAFDELATAVFIDLLEEIAKQQDALELWCDTDDSDQDEDVNDGEALLDGEDLREEGDVVPRADASAPERDRELRSTSSRALDIYLAHGFTVKTKLDGWLLFCQRQGVPPFVAWQSMPGYHRIERVIASHDGSKLLPAPAFTAAGMLRWLTAIKPAAESMATLESMPTLESLITPQALADELVDVFRQRLAWWGGS